MKAALDGALMVNRANKFNVSPAMDSRVDKMPAPSLRTISRPIIRFYLTFIIPNR